MHEFIYSYLFIGYPDSFQEIKGVLKDSIVYLDAEGGSELSFKVHCYSSRWDYRQYENFQIMTRLGRYPILDVIDDVTTWRPGRKQSFLSSLITRNILNTPVLLSGKKGRMKHILKP